VYPCEEEKPPLYQGLNKPAIVTLEEVWPRCGMSEEMYSRKLAKYTHEMDAEFIDYRSGKWSFKVPHFSRFGLASSESDSDDFYDDETDARDYDRNDRRNANFPPSKVCNKV
jgi:nuclear pore complex protein Nup98-Nup96